MTDVTDFRRVKETEVLAKRLGFKLDHRSGGIMIHALKDLPAAIFGKNKEVTMRHTVEEVRSLLHG